VHGPIVAKLGIIKQIPEAKEASDKNTHHYYKRLDQEFASSAYVAGDRFTVADITLLSGVDFATSLVGLKPDENLKNLDRWHKEVSSRPSCSN
jgi:glutathione S-transferase